MEIDAGLNAEMVAEMEVGVDEKILMRWSNIHVDFSQSRF